MAWHILYLTCRTAGPLNSYVTCKIGMYDLVNTVSWLLVMCWYLVRRQLADMGAIVHFYCVLGLCFMFQVLCQHLCFSQLCDMFCASVWDFVSVIQVLCYCIRFCVSCFKFVLLFYILYLCFKFCVSVSGFVIQFCSYWPP